jgi:hypothetical protein
MEQVFFDIRQEESGEILLPTPSTGSGWGQDYLRGMAVSGALARATERAVAELNHEAPLQPSRFTLDLFRPARRIETTVHTEVVRHGRRLVLIDARFEQAGKCVARSATLFLNPTQSPESQIWSTVSEPVPPPLDLQPEPNDERIYYSEGQGWAVSSQIKEGPYRHQSWHVPSQIVQGETPSPFQMAASICDVSNVVSNWGEKGLEFINGDVTLTLARIPKTLRMGLSATGRIEYDGLSNGSAVLYDAEGVFGMSLVTGLANPEARVDPRTRLPYVADRD